MNESWSPPAGGAGGYDPHHPFGSSGQRRFVPTDAAREVDGPPDGPGDRPAPSLASIAGVVAGILLTGGLVSFLDELDDKTRVPGILLCLLFEALGVAIMFLNRGRRAATAGVTLCAIAVVPLVTFLFVDTDNPSKTFETPKDVTGTATSVLVVAALLWLAAYFFAPVKRYAFFLAAALLAVYLVVVVQIVDDPLTEFSNNVEVTFNSTQDEIGVGPTDSYYDEGYDTSFGEDPYYQEDSTFASESTKSSDSTGTKVGWASLIIGLGYLAGAWWRDRSRDARAGTAFAAASIPVLALALIMLSDSFGTAGTSLLAVAFGVAGAVVGTSGGRRATSWAGTASIAFGIIGLIDEMAGNDNGILRGLLLCGAGLGIAALLWKRDAASSPHPEPVPTTEPPSSPSYPPTTPVFDPAPPTAPTSEPIVEPDASTAPPSEPIVEPSTPTEPETEPGDDDAQPSDN